MDEDLLGRLVEFVRGASQVTWEAAYRQVYVEVMQTTLVLAFFVALSIALIVIYRRIAHYGGWCSEDRNMAMACAVAGFVCSCVACTICVSGIASRLINPNLYAIRVLLGIFGVE